MIAEAILKVGPSLVSLGSPRLAILAPTQGRARRGVRTFSDLSAILPSMLRSKTSFGRSEGEEKFRIDQTRREHTVRDAATRLHGQPLW